MKNKKKKHWTKKHKKELSSLLYKIKDNANDIQSFLEQFDDFYDEELESPINSKQRKKMIEVYNACSIIIQQWGLNRVE